MDIFEAFFTKIIHSTLGIIQASVLLREAPELSYIVIRCMQLFDFINQLSKFFSASVFQGVYKRQGHLAFTYVIAGWFTYFSTVIIVKNVITDLENKTYIPTKFTCTF